MHSNAARERFVIEESRIVNLESDVRHLQADVTEIKGEIKSLRSSIDLLRTEFLAFKTEVAKEFGSVRTSIERVKLWMLVTGISTILSVWGAAVALARFLKP
jgi:predicted  nucleic acid-binding Zn-ribbon protein